MLWTRFWYVFLLWELYYIYSTEIKPNFKPGFLVEDYETQAYKMA